MATGIPMPSTGIKTFTPKLKIQPLFNVYEAPITITPVSSLLGPTTSKLPKSDIAAAYLNAQHGIPTSQIKIISAYTDAATGITHVYAQQTIDGTDVANGLANVNINSDNQVISSSQSFALQATSSLTTRSNNYSTLSSAFQALASYVGTAVDSQTMANVTIATTASILPGDGLVYSLSGLPETVAVLGQATAEQSLVQRSDGSLATTWHIVLQQAAHWWSAHVNAQTSAIESINDWVSHAAAAAAAESYNVYPRTIDSPASGSRQVVVNPASTLASPQGWASGNTTTGNNIWAQNNPSGGNTWKLNHRPTTTAKAKVFDFPIDLTKAPSTYVDAAITQLFYTVNTMHDLSFIYGFTEAAGNFQDENYSGQGKGGDYVVAFAQDGSGTDNANFATPPDGQHGVMRMYIWTDTKPNRDGDLEQDIIAHEYTHGISNRLTGGPANTDCLNDGEPGGMGEGWSDAVAILLRIRPSDTPSRDIIMGEYVYGKSIRNYPYSTNLTTNPTTYSYLGRVDYQEVHAIGEMWAEMLYEVMWALIDKNGIADDLFAHDLTKGTSIMLQILLDAMKLQPCNPTFINARDAILQAEANLTGGKNKCAIWKGFAKRGLGPKANNSGTKYTDDTTVPSGC
ncbi:hypothetical protein GGH94_004361 [Coemansia aciculifera]|uniref:Extracellular metalloproteinase n=1 Tax=Coemansia aciculifera TaxID=417176 RepID=A0A9W8M462_9FUNG|nr:hypothetical protein GGH94_004361 [Coemansia aciculifera]KAJ2870499.1 hypothetical protein GGH93_005527 [Coemansia aciculifera]